MASEDIPPRSSYRRALSVGPDERVVSQFQSKENLENAVDAYEDTQLIQCPTSGDWRFVPVRRDNELISSSTQPDLSKDISDFGSSRSLAGEYGHFPDSRTHSAPTKRLPQRVKYIGLKLEDMGIYSRPEEKCTRRVKNIGLKLEDVGIDSRLADNVMNVSANVYNSAPINTRTKASLLKFRSVYHHEPDDASKLNIVHMSSNLNKSFPLDYNISGRQSDDSLRAVHRNDSGKTNGIPQTKLVKQSLRKINPNLLPINLSESIISNGSKSLANQSLDILGTAKISACFRDKPEIAIERNIGALQPLKQDACSDVVCDHKCSIRSMRPDKFTISNEPNASSTSYAKPTLVVAPLSDLNNLKSTAGPSGSNCYDSKYVQIVSETNSRQLKPMQLDFFDHPGYNAEANIEECDLIKVADKNNHIENCTTDKKLFYTLAELPQRQRDEDFEDQGGFHSQTIAGGNNLNKSDKSSNDFIEERDIRNHCNIDKVEDTSQSTVNLDQLNDIESRSQNTGSVDPRQLINLNDILLVAAGQLSDLKTALQSTVDTRQKQLNDLCDITKYNVDRGLLCDLEDTSHFTVSQKRSTYLICGTSNGTSDQGHLSITSEITARQSELNNFGTVLPYASGQTQLGKILQSTEDPILQSVEQLSSNLEEVSEESVYLGPFCDILEPKANDKDCGKFEKIFSDAPGSEDLNNFNTFSKCPSGKDEYKDNEDLMLSSTSMDSLLDSAGLDCGNLLTTVTPSTFEPVRDVHEINIASLEISGISLPVVVETCPATHLASNDIHPHINSNFKLQNEYLGSQGEELLCINSDASNNSFQEIKTQSESDGNDVYSTSVCIPFKCCLTNADEIKPQYEQIVTIPSVIPEILSLDQSTVHTHQLSGNSVAKDGVSGAVDTVKNSEDSDTIFTNRNAPDINITNGDALDMISVNAQVSNTLMSNADATHDRIMNADAQKCVISSDLFSVADIYWSPIDVIIQKSFNEDTSVPITSHTLSVKSEVCDKVIRHTENGLSAESETFGIDSFHRSLSFHDRSLTLDNAKEGTFDISEFRTNFNNPTVPNNSNTEIHSGARTKLSVSCECLRLSPYREVILSFCSRTRGHSNCSTLSASTPTTPTDLVQDTTMTRNASLLSWLRENTESRSTVRLTATGIPQAYKHRSSLPVNIRTIDPKRQLCKSLQPPRCQNLSSVVVAKVDDMSSETREHDENSSEQNGEYDSNQTQQKLQHDEDSSQQENSSDKGVLYFSHVCKMF